MALIDSVSGITTEEQIILDVLVGASNRAPLRCERVKHRERPASFTFSLVPLIEDTKKMCRYDWETSAFDPQYNALLVLSV
jgi:hypothetical protein